MSVEVSIKKQSVLGLVLILIVLLSIEIGIRVYETFSLPCDFVNADAFKNTDFSTKRDICLDATYLETTNNQITLHNPNQNFKTITINSQGLRGPDFSLQKNDDTFRIFIVGGSTAFGSGVTTDEKTIPGFLQEEFDKSGKNVEVINAGIGGAWSFSEKFLIENYIQNYEPDLVVVYDGANDSRYRILANENKIGYNLGGGVGTLIPQFYRTPYFLNDYVFKIGFSEYSDKKNIQIDTEKITSISSLWTQRMQDICNIGNNQNFDVAIILQPMLVTENRELIGDEIIFHETHLETHGENAIEIYDLMKESLTKLHDCTITHDFTDVFDDSQGIVYWDDVHISEEGNEIVSKRLFKLLSPLID